MTARDLLSPAAATSGRQTSPIDTWVSLRREPYTRLTRPRDTTTDEKIEVRMPRQWTTAKPRTAPEPKLSNARPAIRVVTLESRMVPNARS